MSLLTKILNLFRTDTQIEIARIKAACTQPDFAPAKWIHPKLDWFEITLIPPNSNQELCIYQHTTDFGPGYQRVYQLVSEKVIKRQTFYLYSNTKEGFNKGQEVLNNISFSRFDFFIPPYTRISLDTGRLEDIKTKAVKDNRV